MIKWKVFACVSIFSLMSLLMGVCVCTLSSPSPHEEYAALPESTADSVCPHPDKPLLSTIEFLIENSLSDVPQSIPLIQTLKNADGKSLDLTLLRTKDYDTHSPSHAGADHPGHSKHPYTHLDKFYYLYMLKRILI